MSSFPIAEWTKSPTAFPFPQTRDDLNDRIQAFKYAHGRDPVRIYLPPEAEAILAYGLVRESREVQRLLGMEVVWGAEEFDLE